MRDLLLYFSFMAIPLVCAAWVMFIALVPNPWGDD